jgi:hypothetical protein
VEQLLPCASAHVHKYDLDTLVDGIVDGIVGWVGVVDGFVGLALDAILLQIERPQDALPSCRIGRQLLGGEPAVFRCRPHFGLPRNREVAHHRVPLRGDYVLHAQARGNLPASDAADDLGDDGPSLLPIGQANEHGIIAGIGERRRIWSTRLAQGS